MAEQIQLLRFNDTVNCQTGKKMVTVMNLKANLASLDLKLLIPACLYKKSGVHSLEGTSNQDEKEAIQNHLLVDQISHETL
jgi:hypothetical protein